jgi:cell filamentation protein
MTKRFALIKAENRLLLRRREHFVERAAEHIGELNAVHPFREGNGRTLRLFLKEWARQEGHRLSIEKIDREAWNGVSITSFQKQDYHELAQIIDHTIVGPARVVEQKRGRTR